MIVTRKSPLSGKINSIDLPITNEQLARYRKGTELIQDIFPELTPDQREFIITGIPSEEWEEAFGEIDKLKQRMKG